MREILSLIAIERFAQEERPIPEGIEDPVTLRICSSYRAGDADVFDNLDVVVSIRWRIFLLPVDELCGGVASSRQIGSAWRPSPPHSGTTRSAWLSLTG